MAEPEPILEHVLTVIFGSVGWLSKRAQELYGPSRGFRQFVFLAWIIPAFVLFTRPVYYAMLAFDAPELFLGFYLISLPCVTLVLAGAWPVSPELTWLERFLYFSTRVVLTGVAIVVPWTVLVLVLFLFTASANVHWLPAALFAVTVGTVFLYYLPGAIFYGLRELSIETIAGMYQDQDVDEALQGIDTAAQRGRAARRRQRTSKATEQVIDVVPVVDTGSDTGSCSHPRQKQNRGGARMDEARREAEVARIDVSGVPAGIEAQVKDLLRNASGTGSWSIVSALVEPLIAEARRRNMAKVTEILTTMREQVDAKYELHRSLGQYHRLPASERVERLRVEKEMAELETAIRELRGESDEDRADQDRRRTRDTASKRRFRKELLEERRILQEEKAAEKRGLSSIADPEERKEAERQIDIFYERAWEDLLSAFDGGNA